jgi:hypothetical protein
MRYLNLMGALAATLAASSAFALGPTTTTSVQTVVSGSSAFKTNFAAEFANICQAGTLDTYSAAGSPAPNMSAYSCTLTTDTTIIPAAQAALRGLNAILYYRAEGGSAYGVAPIAKGQQIFRLVVDANCTGTSPTWTCPVTGWNFAAETGAGNIVKDTTELGVSDVEPSKFVGDNWPGGFFGAAPTAAQLANITSIKPVTGQVFAIYVNSSVSATPISLSKAAVAAILEGSATDWSAVPKLDGSGFVSATSSPITVCNRDKGSGTRAGVGFFFTGYGCTPSGVALVVSSLAINASGGSETTCIAGGAGRIGYLGFSGATDPAGMVHVNIDGIAPNLHDAAAGGYGYWFEATFNNGTALTGNDALLATLLAARIRSAATVPATNVNALVLSDFNTPVEPVSTAVNPVAVTTHSGNSCNTPISVF